MHRAKALWTLVVIFSATLCSAQSVIPESERDALIAFYNSTGGDDWHNNSGWLGPAGTEGSWYGVTVRYGHVKELDLNGNNLVGTLPEELGDLSYLEHFRIHYNHLEGGFPASFWNLTELLVFAADYNGNFRGEILPAIGNMSRLRIFSAPWAGLEGPIPPEIGNLTELNYLLLGKNNLSGTLPKELGNCTKLEALGLFKNQITGPIPDDWQQLTELRFLAVGYLPRRSDGSWVNEPQQPQGPFPAWIGELRNLTQLKLYSAGLTGEIPESICNLTDIEFLLLDLNHLTGTIPTCMTQLSSMYFFSMCDNFLEGPIPSGLGGLEALEVVDLSGNLLSGDIPPDITQAPNLQDLTLGFNQLSGPIPLGFGALEHFSWLDLMSNQLTGTIPPDLGDSPTLEFLRLADNQLTGPIPSDLGDISTLTRLILSQNPFDPGPIPTWVGDLSNLIALYLFDTNREGPIPPEIGNLANLFAMNIGMNRLNGTIPDELCNLERMSYLQIADADLEGEIPPCLAALPRLVSLKLERNHLSGAIPEGFSGKPFLSDVSLGGNMLTGLPDDLLEIQESQNLWLGSNALPIDDHAANAFLNVLNPDPVPFEETQTVAPTDVFVVSTTSDTVELGWTPIPYKSYEGRYEVFVSAGASFGFAGSTENKAESSIAINDLEPGTTYWFKLRTVTEPVTDPENTYHRNKNTVVSEWSGEVSTTTEPPPDRDGDGIPDAVDSCPDSDDTLTVVIDGCDSGVPNHLADDGCTIADLIREIAASATNHGEFVSGVAALTNAFKKDGIISGREKGRIQRCAARADIP